MQLHDRVSLITGAASGIGRATALRFAAEGARIAAVDRDAPGLRTLEEAIAALGGACQTVARDIQQPGAPEETVAAVLQAWGRLDHLVTAAGISQPGTVLETTDEHWERILAVNATGTFRWVRAALPPMLAARHGAIVTIASQLAEAGGAFRAAYVASKGAVLALTRNVALDYAAQGIRANCLLPGATDTPLLRGSFTRQPQPEQAEARSLARHPMGRFGRPEEVAHAALYLVSDEAGFATGVALPVDGGWLAG